METAVWVALGFALLSLLTSLALFVSWASLRRRLTILQGRNSEADLIQAATSQAEAINVLHQENRELLRLIQQLQGAFKTNVQYVYVNRYDAFDDMGGQLSFSAALLDGNGDGVVITCINGRTDARTYAKPVTGGDSAFNLSPEESEAIKKAVAGV